MYALTLEFPRRSLWISTGSVEVPATGTGGAEAKVHWETRLGHCELLLLLLLLFGVFVCMFRYRVRSEVV